MKTVRIICITIAWIWLVLFTTITLNNFLKLPTDTETAFRIGYLIGSLIFTTPSAILFLVARKIRRRLEKKQTEKLIDSFENV